MKRRFLFLLSVMPLTLIFITEALCASVNSDNITSKNESTTSILSSISDSETKIGCPDGEGFFSLEVFENIVYAGAYHYASAGTQNLIYKYDPKNNTFGKGPHLHVNESICAMTEFKGNLYANTEDGGEVYKLGADDIWQLVLKGSNNLGCGFTIKDGYLYATNSNFTIQSGKIYRTIDGNIWGNPVYDSIDKVSYIRDIKSFKGKLYAFSNDATKRPVSNWILESSNGVSWKRTETKDIDSNLNVNFRPYRGVSTDDYLWITTSKIFSDIPESAIYRYDGESLKKMYSDAYKSHISDIIEINGVLIATTNQSIEANVIGGASIIMSIDSGKSWETVHVFQNDAEARSLKFFNGKLYVGTKQKKSPTDAKVGGCLYSFDVSKVINYVIPLTFLMPLLEE